MKFRWVLVIMFCLPGWCREPQIISDARDSETARNLASYDGKWWAEADNYEREGFLWGADDCERWDAHVPSSYRVPEEEISRYYQTHPGDRGLAVVEVSKKLAPHIRIQKPPEGAEDYTNRHGFFDGSWYRLGSESERFGFLEGYIGCLRTYVKGGVASYPKPIHYYDDKIWDYVDTQGLKGSQEAVADILSRFRSKTKAN